MAKHHHHAEPDRDARPWLDVAVVAAHPERPGLVLVGRHHDRGWVFPGGRVNPFDGLEDTARREFQEETGLSVALGAQLHTFEVIDRRADYHKAIVVYSATAGAGDPAGSDDLSAVAWRTLHELATDDETADWAVRVCLWLAGHQPG